MFFQPAARAPIPHYDYRLAPRFERRRPKVVRTDQPPSKPPLKPRPLGEVSNPVPELLADSTLRRGDIVMFPDGLRVFLGQSRTRHALDDFVPLSDTKAVPPATRKLVANLRPGWNGAWAAEAAKSDGRLAATSDVASTGSIRRRRR
jgi:hypothetical protein